MTAEPGTTGTKIHAEEQAERQAALAFALSLADVAEPITMRHFRSTDLVIETKPDLTEVTVADRSTEQAIRDAIVAGSAEPGHEAGVTVSLASSRSTSPKAKGTAGRKVDTACLYTS